MDEHSDINHQQSRATDQQLAISPNINHGYKSDEDDHKDVNTQHPYGRASWRDKKKTEVLEEVVTNFPNLLASLLYFIYTNIRTILATLIADWSIIIQHPISTLVRYTCITLSLLYPPSHSSLQIGIRSSGFSGIACAGICLLP